MIDPKLHPNVAYVFTTHKIWENLQKRYLVPYVPCTHQLKADVASYMQEKQDLMEFFNKLMVYGINSKIT